LTTLVSRNELTRASSSIIKVCYNNALRSTGGEDEIHNQTTAVLFNEVQA
jgi:hypothetical protein